MQPDVLTAHLQQPATQQSLTQHNPPRQDIVVNTLPATTLHRTPHSLRQPPTTVATELAQYKTAVKNQMLTPVTQLTTLSLAVAGLVVHVTEQSADTQLLLIQPTSR